MVETQLGILHLNPELPAAHAWPEVLVLSDELALLVTHGHVEPAGARRSAVLQRDDFAPHVCAR